MLAHVITENFLDHFFRMDDLFSKWFLLGEKLFLTIAQPFKAAVSMSFSQKVP